MLEIPMTQCSKCQEGGSTEQIFCSLCGSRLTQAPCIGRLVPQGIPELESEIPIQKFPFRIGRSRECDLFLNLNSISRRHAVIDREDGVLQVRDEGSVNGTFLNDVRIDSRPLNHSDHLRFGNADFIFFEVHEHPGKSALFRTKDTSLQMLLDVAKAINSSLILEDVLQKVLHSVIEITGCERSFLLSKNELKEWVILAQVIEQGGQNLMGTPQISMSTVNKVFESGIAMISIDVDSDTNIRSQNSIVSLGLRSIMCVPMKIKNGIWGIIYVDSNRRAKNFTKDDLDVLECLADHAAIAIENAHLQKSLLEKQRIEQELEFAAIIQQSFLPSSSPQVRNYSIEARNLSAKIVGGDFFDFLSLDSRRLGIAIGDVSGKGVPAALYMARLISDFHFLAQNEISPAAILQKMNEQLTLRSRRGMFVTMLYLLLDTESGNVTYVNAGHLPFLIQHQGRIHLLSEGEGIPLGILPGAEYQDSNFTLAPGNRILLFTDGVTEAADTNQERFSLERVIRHMAQAGDSLSLTQSLFEEVQQFASGAPQHDDITLLCVHRLNTLSPI
jgi:phosphoserine phosphatase RsbU/P